MKVPQSMASNLGFWQILWAIFVCFLVVFFFIRSLQTWWGCRDSSYWTSKHPWSQPLPPWVWAFSFVSLLEGFLAWLSLIGFDMNRYRKSWIQLLLQLRSWPLHLAVLSCPWWLRGGSWAAGAGCLVCFGLLWSVVWGSIFFTEVRFHQSG